MNACLVKILNREGHIIINSASKNYLDRKTADLYYTKKLGIVCLNMKKSIAITIAFLFSGTVLLSGAFGYSDCAAKCAYEMAMAHQHTAMGSASLAAPNCCSGTMKNSCEMATTVEIKIPECCMTSHQTVAPDPIGMGFISSDIATDNFRATQSNRRFIAGKINKAPPIYLQTLSILC